MEVVGGFFLVVPKRWWIFARSSLVDLFVDFFGWPKTLVNFVGGFFCGFFGAGRKRWWISLVDFVCGFFCGFFLAGQVAP